MLSHDPLGVRPINAGEIPDTLCEYLSGISALVQEKKKLININKFAGLSRDWVGAKNLFMCFCFFGSFLMGEKNT